MTPTTYKMHNKTCMLCCKGTPKMGYVCVSITSLTNMHEYMLDMYRS